jgi:uncharacterized protein
MTNHFIPSFDNLPETLPLFPLAGALLLPRGRMPLNIFEPRYIAMVEDALATGRMIAIVQPQDDDKSIYKIGCAGRIVAFAETEDNRLLITLEGVCRFRITEEIPTTRGYKRIMPLWDDFKTDLNVTEDRSDHFNRDALIAKLRPYFKVQGIMANWETIEELSAEKLVTAVSTSCPFTATEKQALLEAKDMGARFDLLLMLLDMGSRGDGDGMRH